MNGVENAAVLVSYDDAQSVDSHRLVSDDPASSQALAFEFMRRLAAEGFSVQSYNDGTDADWQDLVRAVVAGIGGTVAALSWPDQLAAANLGGNYFEHGHDFIIAGTAAENRTTATKPGPV